MAAVISRRPPPLRDVSELRSRLRQPLPRTSASLCCCPPPTSSPLPRARPRPRASAAPHNTLSLSLSLLDIVLNNAHLSFSAPISIPPPVSDPFSLCMISNPFSDRKLGPSEMRKRKRDEESNGDSRKLVQVSVEDNLSKIVNDKTKAKKLKKRK